MANCTICGAWAGVSSNLCSPSCPPAPTASQYKSMQEEMIKRLTPVILRAGRSAGIAAALTLVGIGLALLLVRLFFSTFF